MTESTTDRTFPTVRRLEPPNARQRLLHAVIDQSAVVGFHDVVVNDLCELSGISRRTFYNYFPDVPELFFAAYGQIDEELRQALRQAWAASGHDPGAVADALVAFACADPVRADAFFVQALAAGWPVVEQRRRTLAWCGTLLATGREDGGGSTPWWASLSFEIVCGGVWDVIRTRVASGELAALRRDATDLVAIVATCGRVASADASAHHRRGGTSSAPERRLEVAA